MRLDLYQLETAQNTKELVAVLNEVRSKIAAGDALSKLEQNGVLHALQLLIENSIGKAKQILKSKNEPVLASAYDTFS